MIKFQSFLSGSTGNATFVTNDAVHLLVDCGANGKYITECLRRIGVAPEHLSGIFITHEHSDHILGAGILSRRYHLPIYATEKTWSCLKQCIGKIAPENMKIVSSDIILGDITIHPFSIPHDAIDPVGYRFESNDDSLTIATDLGCITEELFQNLKGSRTVILEANHDIELLKNGPYPYPLKARILGKRGHLSNEDCGLLCASLAQSGTKAIWLGHLSAENNRPELAYDTVMNFMTQDPDITNIGVTLNILPKNWIAS